MGPRDPFSPDYDTARRRFRDAATDVGARLSAHPHGAAELTTDVATLGVTNPEWVVVVTSGLHGVEGFFGSAAQLAWLRARPPSPARDDGAVVLAHALNPYGFAHHRRVDAHNVDLNRNFLPEDAPRATSTVYARLDPLLNPPTPLPRVDAFIPRALWQIARAGLPALKQAVAVGQHDFPRGLFYAGDGPTPSTRLIQTQLPAWTAGARRIVFVDLHTGLGAHGRCRLLLDTGDPHVEWYRETFGAEAVEPTAGGAGTAYDAAGTLGRWVRARPSPEPPRFVTAEFGTYHVLRVLAALRAENRMYFHGGSQADQRRVRRELRECFCPAAPAWRARTLARAMDVIDQAIAGASTHR